MVKVVLVGCGAIAKNHLHGWRAAQNAQLVAVCDKKEEKAKAKALEFGIPSFYRDADTMMQETDFDCVDIATHPDTHVPLIEKFADGNYHILCQKPFSFSFPEAKRAVKLCEEKKVTLMIHQNFRFQPFPRYLKTIIKSGEIGQIHYLRIFHRLPYSVERPDGRITMNDREPHIAKENPLLLRHMVIHHLDTSRYLMGEPEKLFVSLKRVSKNTQGENLVCLILEYRDKICTIEESWVTSGIEEIGFHIEGDKGTVKVCNKELNIFYRNGTRRGFPLEYLYPDFKNTKDVDKYSFPLVQKHFIDSVISNEEPETSGRKNLGTLKLVEAGYESASTGNAVFLATEV